MRTKKDLEMVQKQHKEDAPKREAQYKNDWVPGPWIVRDHPSDPCEIVGGGNTLAHVFATDYPIGKANAELIAAAPDLVAALEIALKCIEKFVDHDGQNNGPIGTINAALNKARGQSI